MKEEQSYPIADVAMNKKSNGSTTSGISDNGALSSDDFQWVEYYEDFYLTFQDGSEAGDWWAKNATVNITSFDATSLKVTADVNATMFSAAEAFVNSPEHGFNQVGVDAASTAPMTVKITNVDLTSSTKNINKKKGASSKATLGIR